MITVERWWKKLTRKVGRSSATVSNSPSPSQCILALVPSLLRYAGIVKHFKTNVSKSVSSPKTGDWCGSALHNLKQITSKWNIQPPIQLEDVHTWCMNSWLSSPELWPITALTYTGFPSADRCSIQHTAFIITHSINLQSTRDNTTPRLYNAFRVDQTF
jgi:hypothetical protein